MFSRNTTLCFYFCCIFLLLTGCGGGSSSPPPTSEPPPQAKGEITISITGVPNDVVADVTLSISVNGVGTVWNINQSQTVANLSPGRYSLRSFTFKKSLTEYILLSDSAQVVELAAGESKNVEIDYDTRDIIPGTFNLTIDKSLLQSGVVVPSILIEGVDGFSQVFTDSAVVTDLIPGEYPISAPDFVFQSQNYGFNFDFFHFSIQEGLTFNNNVIITPIPVRIKSIELLPKVTILGVPDGQGNFYTLENQPQVNRLGVAKHFIHKWNSQGNKIWSTEITGQTYQFWSWRLAVDTTGNVYLAGFEDTGIFVGIQNRNLQAQIYKYNSLGQFIWQKNLPQLYGLELAKVNRMGVQDNKIVLFSTHIPLQGNPSKATQALVSVVNTENGTSLNTISDSTINGFTQLMPIENQGYWVFATDKIMHYSVDGIVLESFFTGNGTEPFGRDITGGVAFQPDPLGGLFVFTTIDGQNDSDVQLTKYDDDFNVIWQQSIPNLGREYIEKISYDNITGKILIQFYTNGNFPNMKGNRVISEWNSSGQQIWLRQFQGITGQVLFTTRELNNDWRIIFNTSLGDMKGQYGIGNSIVIGP